MMHRGDLAERGLDDVLRAAAGERLTGGIELDGDEAVCVYLEDGHVYLAARAGADAALTVDDAMDDATYEAARVADEARLRAESVGVLAEAVARDRGWYFFHHLTEHEAQGLWHWSVDELLAEVAPDPTPQPAPPAQDTAEDAAPVTGAVGATSGEGPTATDGPAPRRAGGVDGRPPARLVPDPPDAPVPPPAPPDDGAQVAGDVGAEPAVGAVAGEPGDVAEGAAPLPGSPGATSDADAARRDAGSRWRLSPSPPEESFDATAWALLVAMAGEVDPAAVTAHLGWSVEQAQTAFGRLVAQGVLVPAVEGDRGEVLGGRIRRLAR